MALKVVDSGELGMLEILRSAKLNDGNIRFRLFKNDHTPANADDISDYTEADYDGYAEQAASAWVLSTLVGGKAFTQSTALVFLCTGSVTPNDIYGYYVVDMSSGDLWWAERFASAPIVMDSPGDTISITPTLSAASES